MTGRVISIADRGREGKTAARRAAAPGPDIERVRRALSERFAVEKMLESDSKIERYLASDMRGWPVQLNVLSSYASNDVRERELFYLSSQASTKLSHMNVLATGHAEQHYGVDFCVVEHKKDAQSLGALLDQSGWLDVKVAAGIADQIASALDHAHQLGVLHLELKPECVLIEPDGWVTVAGFGIEANRGASRSLGPRAPYASPEQLMGGTAGHRSDLYSLGALLYEMLTDRTPYDSTDAECVRRKQESLAPAPPHLISVDVPEPVSNVVMKLLERQPARRFESASAFQAALDGAVHGG